MQPIFFHSGCVAVNAQEKGANYNGQSTYTTCVDYLGTEYVEKALVIPGRGYQVVFDTDGGSLIGLADSGLLDTTKDTGFTKVSVNPVKDWFSFLMRLAASVL